MDIKEYSKSVCDFIDNLSDEEFDQILIESGLESCPFKDYEEIINISLEIPNSEQWVYMKTDAYYINSQDNNFNQYNKVA